MLCYAGEDQRRKIYAIHVKYANGEMKEAQKQHRCLLVNTVFYGFYATNYFNSMKAFNFLIRLKSSMNVDNFDVQGTMKQEAF